MKYAFLLAVVMFLSAGAYCQTWIRAEDATHFDGDVINTVGYISKVIFSAVPQNVPIIIRVNEKDSARMSLVMIISSDLLSKEKMRAQYLNQYVQVKGKVFVSNGTPQVNLSSPKQITITAEPNHRVDRDEPQ